MELKKDVKEQDDMLTSLEVKKEFNKDKVKPISMN